MCQSTQISASFKSCTGGANAAQSLTFGVAKRLHEAEIQGGNSKSASTRGLGVTSVTAASDVVAVDIQAN